MNVAGPQVLGVSPADQLTNVPRNAQVTIDFDRAIDTLTANQITLGAGGQIAPVILGFGNGDTRIVKIKTDIVVPETLKEES